MRILCSQKQKVHEPKTNASNSHCRSAPAAVSTAHCLTSTSAATFTLFPGPPSSLTASAPPKTSLRLVSSTASSLSQSSSMSSFMPSRSSQTAASETEPSLGLADWYAAMVSLRKSCLALRSCFFCCSLIFCRCSRNEECLRRGRSTGSSIREILDVPWHPSSWTPRRPSSWPPRPRPSPSRPSPSRPSPPRLFSSRPPSPSSP